MYQGPQDRVGAWMLVLNAINYCYWPDKGCPRWWSTVRGEDVGRDDEALGVMACLSEALHQGAPLYDGRWLEGLDLKTLEQILAPAEGAGQLPMLPERLAAIRELGVAMTRSGGATGLLQLGRGSALRLMLELVKRCPSWEDARILRGQRVRFLKRAQLLVAMLYGRLGGQGLGAFDDIHQLTVFADYRVPQVLRGAGLLRLSPDLDARVAGQEELLEGSEEEVLLRAATVVLGEKIRLSLLPRFPGVTALQTDHLLWRMGVELQDSLPEFHRCRTTAY